MDTVATKQPMYGWNSVRWPQVERAVFKLQKRIFRASLRGDHKTVHSLQKLLTRSWSARLLATRRVTQENRGKRTAGVDGRKAFTPAQRFALAARLLLSHRASPVRRVWIPKPGSDEKRPLGIPTISDRARQALIVLALEPEWEAKFEPNSYGFRPGRSCWDAIAALFIGVVQKPKWTLDADIEKCYDRISHPALLAKLHTTPSIRRQIRAWLKAGVVDGGALFPTEEGVPQGGPLSCLLANVALHGLETAVKEAYGRKAGAPLLVRYADDLAVLHPDRTVVEKCQEVISAFLAPMGLKLKAAKTRIVHTLTSEEGEPGFTFLGFRIRQYPTGKLRSGKTNQGERLGFKTYITPAKEAVRRHWLEVAQAIDSHRAVTQEELIRILNPQIRGWSNYYSTVCSSRAFKRLERALFAKLWSWARWRHPNKGRRWVARKYWRMPRGKSWVFMPRGGSIPLHRHIETRIRRHVKVQGARSPYDGDWAYWGTRAGAYKTTSKRVARLLKKQEGRCWWCGLSFRPGDSVEVDHIIPRELGGRDEYENLQLLHEHCHHEKSANDLEEQRLTQRVVEEVGGMNDNHRGTEEPCELKGSSTVLKPSRRGDTAA